MSVDFGVRLVKHQAIDTLQPARNSEKADRVRRVVMDDAPGPHVARIGAISAFQDRRPFLSEFWLLLVMESRQNAAYADRTVFIPN